MKTTRSSPQLANNRKKKGGGVGGGEIFLVFTCYVSPPCVLEVPAPEKENWVGALVLTRAKGRILRREDIENKKHREGKTLRRENIEKGRH